jgi:hypothetical protein
MAETFVMLLTILVLALVNILLMSNYQQARSKLREINDFITILDKAIEDGNITKEELDKLWAKFKDIVTSKQDK